MKTLNFTFHQNSFALAPEKSRHNTGKTVPSWMQVTFNHLHPALQPSEYLNLCQFHVKSSFSLCVLDIRLSPVGAIATENVINSTEEKLCRQVCRLKVYILFAIIILMRQCCLYYRVTFGSSIVWSTWRLFLSFSSSS